MHTRVRKMQKQHIPPSLPYVIKTLVDINYSSPHDTPDP